MVTINKLQDTFKYSIEAFEESRREAIKTIELYDNNQYTDEELCILKNRGQPAETFNIVKMFARFLIGYYSTVATSAVVTARKQSSVIKAATLNDTLQYIFNDNNFNSEGDKIKLDCILTGIMAVYKDVVDTGEVDEFGRPKYEIKLSHTPSIELALDPASKLEDYSDARFIHRYKWLTEETVIELFGKDVLKDLEAYHNNLDVDEANFEYQYNVYEEGKYKLYDNYLVIHSIIKDEEGKTWSVYWSADTILSYKEITFKESKNPYRIHKLHSSHKAQFYGIFHDVIETQRAINQALLKIQLLVNTQKAFVQDNAVEDINNFTDSFYRVNSVIQVRDLAGIRIENMTSEILQQYTIIDKALDRIQRVLSINDSFLGMAYASDSGAKVRLQQNASIVALRYVTLKVEQFYRLLGKDIVGLIKQYYTYHDVFRLADDLAGQRFFEINRPLQLADGTPVWEEVLDPDTNEPILDENGNILMSPIPTLETELKDIDADVNVESVAYDNEDEKTRVILEQLLNSPMGNYLLAANPAAYLKIAALSVKNIKFKYSLEISNILDEIMQSMTAQQQRQLQMMAQGQNQQQAINQQIGRPSQGRG